MVLLVIFILVFFLSVTILFQIPQRSNKIQINNRKAQNIINDKDTIFDKDFETLKQENEKWSYQFGKVADIYKTAKKIEQTNPYKAIELYLSIRDTSYGNFDTLGRLIILYRKTKQVEKEIQHIDFKIEQEQNRQYNRKESLKKSYPKSADYIEKCYRKNIPFVNPHPLYSNSIDFFAEIKKLSKRKLDLLNKIKQ